MPDVPPAIPDYTLLRAIGKGSYGEVWLARSVTGLFRAAKIVYRASFGHDRPYEREFAGIKSFEPISRSQENMMDVFHVGRNGEAGYFYYVMELADDASPDAEKAADGESAGPSQPSNSQFPALNSRTFNPATYRPKTLREALERSGRMPVAACLPVALGLTRAVAHLHSFGLIHRDIKPSNIIFVNGAPKLADIGLLSAVEESRSFVGTEGFVPPEGPGTPGADVFSLGKLLYEMSTGRDRLEFPKLPEAFEALTGRVAFLEFNEVVLKACDPDPARRYASAQELLNDLLLLQAGKSVRRLRLMESRFALAIKMTAVTTVLTVLAVGAWIWASRQAEEARRNFAISERHRRAAEAALREAQLSQIRADRQTGWTGQRFDTLVKLREAAAETNSLALRNEAIACLAQADARPWRTLPFSRGRQIEWDRQLTRYATNDAAGNITIRSATDDRVLHFLPTPGARLYGMGFSADDLTLGVSYFDERFCAWNLAGQPFLPSADHKLVQTFAALPDATRPRLIQLPRGATSGTGTPDGGTLVVHCRDGSLHFIEVGTGRTTRRFPGPFSGSAARFNSTGSKFSIASTNEVRTYRADSGELLFTLPHPLPVTSVAWHPDGRRLASSCMDYKIRLWDTVTGQQVSAFEDHEAEAMVVTFDASGTLMASVGWDGITRLWNPEASRPLVRILGGGNDLHLAADGSRLAYIDWDSSRVRVLEITPGREMISLQRFAGIYSINFSPDSAFLAATTKEGVQIWQLPFFHPVAALPEREGHPPIFHPAGDSLFTCGYSGIHQWPLRYDPASGFFEAGPLRVIGDSDGKSHRLISLSADGETVLALGDAGLWMAKESDGWKPQPRLVQGKPSLVDLSPDARWVATCDSKAGLQVWSANGMELVTNLAPARVNLCRFSPDSRWLAAADGRSYRFWETGTWKPGPEFPQEVEVSGREVFVFDASTGIVALRDRSKAIRLINFKTWSEVATIPVHLTTTALAFSRQGNHLAVATEKLGVQVWDLHSIRKQLAGLNLDWPPPALAGPAKQEVPLRPLQARVAPRPSIVTNADPALTARLPSHTTDIGSGLIDLTPYFNAEPHAGWIPAFHLGTTPDHALPVPLGQQTFAGTDFEVRGVVQLASSVLKGRGANFPVRANAIPIHRLTRRLHFLHGTDWSMPKGTTIGGFVVRYVTGEDHAVPIVIGQDVWDWWTDPTAKGMAGGAVVAWTGTNTASARQNAAIRLYKTTWENPLWDVEVACVDFVSLQTKCGPFLLAITAE